MRNDKILKTYFIMYFILVTLFLIGCIGSIVKVIDNNLYKVVNIFELY